MHYWTNEEEEKDYKSFTAAGLKCRIMCYCTKPKAWILALLGNYEGEIELSADRVMRMEYGIFAFDREISLNKMQW